jgi:hypothetical protein
LIGLPAPPTLDWRHCIGSDSSKRPVLASWPDETVGHASSTPVIEPIGPRIVFLPMLKTGTPTALEAPLHQLDPGHPSRRAAMWKILDLPQRTFRDLLKVCGMALAVASLGQAYAAEPDPVRAKLISAAAGTLELIKDGEESNRTDPDLARKVAPQLFDELKFNEEPRRLLEQRFATRGDVRRYTEQRPWMRQ